MEKFEKNSVYRQTYTNNFFPLFLSGITICIGSGEVKNRNSDFGPFGDDCKVSC